ncbi:MAG: peptidoglycan DD-metalloendopeptidase family protein [Candidatus Cryptobacteroides sp.]|nr:peptidoglycan DD-metalloendopeptidase family protein [Candidatus Cryptobacteroides sp.]
MTKKCFWLMSMAILSVFLTFSCRNASVSDTPVEDTPVFPLGFNPSTFEADTFRVKSGETLSLLFAKLGLSQKDAYDLVQAADSVFPAKNLRSGKTCVAFRDSSQLQYLVYEQDKVSSVVFRCTPPFEAWACEKEVVTSQRFADVTINTSLWVDMKNAGVSPLLILSLSDVYAWTVDFFGLQQGDRFRVVYDEKSVEDEVIAVDTIRTAQFIRGTDTLSCFMFNQGDGGNIYWNGKGESMRKAFLKAPLHFSRISSGFSYARKHPITRKVQPHTGVDYAAPAGTPVVSIGDGTVIAVGYKGAGGNTVKIRHNSVYTTAYMHLKGYAKGVKTGTRVRQGQTIGYVGSTGRSTGPHLDFRVWKNGSPINPLKMQSPPAEPVRTDLRPQFEAQKSRLDSLMLSSN